MGYLVESHWKMYENIMKLVVGGGPVGLVA